MNSRTSFLIGPWLRYGAPSRRQGSRPGTGLVATGRDTDAVAAAVGEAEELLVAELDITSPASAAVAVGATLERFGRIHVLLNNAGNFYAGFFEELTPDEV
jgi:NAD(P)-dependent dehydrogenase (short-subunit alcohol dehydrogenase family)